MCTQNSDGNESENDFTDDSSSPEVQENVTSTLGNKPNNTS